MKTFQKSDVGVKFRATITDEGAVFNISAATSKKLIFLTSDGDIKEKDATFETTGADGVIFYTSDITFLDSCGTWEYQALVVCSGRTLHSEIKSFLVKDNLIQRTP